jgi:hypothetical protein
LLFSATCITSDIAACSFVKASAPPGSLANGAKTSANNSLIFSSTILFYRGVKLLSIHVLSICVELCLDCIMHILVGSKEIASFLGIHRARIYMLVSCGAPVRVVQRKRGDARSRRYLADGDALASWVRCEIVGDASALTRSQSRYCA